MRKLGSLVRADRRLVWESFFFWFLQSATCLPFFGVVGFLTGRIVNNAELTPFSTNPRAPSISKPNDVYRMISMRSAAGAQRSSLRTVYPPSARSSASLFSSGGALSKMAIPRNSCSGRKGRFAGFIADPE